MYLEKLMQRRLLNEVDGDGGGDGAPAAGAEPTTPAPSGDQPGQVAEVDFAALSKEFDEDLEPVEPTEPAPTPEPAPQASPATAAPPATTPTTVPPAQAAPPQTPAQPAQPAAPQQPAPQAQPQAPAAPASAPAPQQPAQEAITPERIEQSFNQYREQIIPQLEQMYKLTPEQEKELDENPSQAIPKIAARVHYQAHIAAYTGIMSQLPKIVSSLLVRVKDVEKAESAFYERWPDLKKPEHENAVNETLRSFRAANPNITTEQMIEKAGLIAMISLGLGPTTAAPAHQPALPASPPPMRPAGTGGAGQQRVRTGGAGNVWDEMVEDILEEDRV